MESKNKKRKASVLIADDDRDIREFVTETLELEGYDVTSFDPESSNFKDLNKHFDVAILDIFMGQYDGFSIRKKVLDHSPFAQIIMITGQPDSEMLDKSCEAGVFTFLPKPFKSVHIKYAVMGALKLRDASSLNAYYKTSEAARQRGMIGESDYIKGLYKQIAKFGPTELPILIRGESGTGKDVVAQLIHEFSKRKDKPLIAVNCAALTASLAESELFGHTKGAFTGAIKNKHGFFEVANDGTLFLDEVAELPLDAQAKLLRVLDKGEFQRVGETQTHRVNVRIISATNQNLEEYVKDGRFREDLYFRLKGLQVFLIPLRDRKMDIIHLIQYFLSQSGSSMVNTAIEKLCQYHWPGNIRELKMVLDSLVGLNPNGVIHLEDVMQVLPSFKKNNDMNSPGRTYQEFKNEVLKPHETQYFSDLLEQYSGNISKVAREAGIQRKHLYDKLKLLNISPNRN